MSSLISGFSISAIIISLGIYEKVVEILANIFKKENKKYITLIISLILGFIIFRLIGIKLVSYLLDSYQVQTILFFIGLIMGGYRLIIKKTKIEVNLKNTIIFLLIFIGGVLINILLKQIEPLQITNIISSTSLGIVSGLFILLPGIFESFSLLITDIFTLNIPLLTTIFIIGIIIGLLTMAKLLNYSFKQYKTFTYIMLSALLTSTVVIALLTIDKFTINFVNIFTSILTFLWGYILSKNLENE